MMKVVKPATEDYLSERQSSSSSEHKNVNDQFPIVPPTTRDLENVPHILEARAALPMMPLPPRDSYTDGYYQPFVCSSRFGTHITAPGCLHLIYSHVLDGMDQIHLRNHYETGSGVRLPFSINHFVNPNMPFVVITRNSDPLQYPLIEQSQNIQMLLFRMMLHCVVGGGGVGGQGSLLSGVTVTLYGIEKSDGEESLSDSEESEAGNPADLFPDFVPGRLAHTGSRQGIMPMQGGY
ncbi:hypothetical protein MMC34_006773 [Xylographa carneopallida]|nr:hypothetical protein [Xylographa carneopallida]